VINEFLGEPETSKLVGLISSVNPKVVIEIGCNTGRTAARLLAAIPSIERYIGIDVPHGHETTLACQRREVPVEAGLYAANDARFFLFEADSRTLTPADLEPCDAVFIDGDHSEGAVMHDSKLAHALTRPGGIIVWHDSGNPAVEVTPVLEKLKAEGWSIESLENSWLAFMRVEAPKPLEPPAPLAEDELPSLT